MNKNFLKDKNLTLRQKEILIEISSKLEALVCYYMLDLDISEEEASALIIKESKRRFFNDKKNKSKFSRFIFKRRIKDNVYAL